jgi:hypothetical protein
VCVTNVGIYERGEPRGEVRSRSMSVLRSWGRCVKIIGQGCVRSRGRGRDRGVLDQGAGVCYDHGTGVCYDHGN